MYEIIDNYLKEDDFIKIEKWILHRDFMWHFVDKPNRTSTNETQFQFGRVFIEYGYTELENGEKVNTVKNRALIFDAHLYHQTVTQTDSLFRRNININFKEL